MNCAISVKSKSKASENLWADTDEEDNADSIDGDANNDEDGNDGQANFTILCVEPYIFENEDLFLSNIIGTDGPCLMRLLVLEFALSKISITQIEQK